MSPLARLTATEFALVRRDRSALPLTFLLPLGLLVGFGLGDGMRERIPELGGFTAFEIFIVPIALVLVVTMLPLQVLPVTLASYRERGVLRRMATTPVHPGALLGAQLLVHLGMLVGSLALTAAVAVFGFGVSVPTSAGGVVGILALGAAALYAMGVAVAALAPKASTATAIGMGLFFPQLLLGGLMVPADQLPEVMARVGEFLPAGATLHGLQAAWTGEGVATLHLVVLVAWALGLGVVAARRFRWD
ncbi:ABC transporter permease [Egicoccus halophilus]|uniref:Transport permease protein n=1 Tax=Egicoccus halophilus TaxID=1670830 RepID=A0A8J3EUB1_9ACTN|nr:ABC transporter permease [Egicoccus halophilus]GGI05522.1 transport permease protein [Egicoccus halophilus]